MAYLDKVSISGTTYNVQDTPTQAGVSNVFSATTAYSAGQYVWYDGDGTGAKLYRFTAAHAAGAWVGTDAIQVSLANDVSNIKSNVDFNKNAITTSKNIFDVYNPGYTARTYINSRTVGNQIGFATSSSAKTYKKCVYLEANVSYTLSYTNGTATNRRLVLCDDDEIVLEAITYAEGNNAVTFKFSESGWLYFDISNAVPGTGIMIEQGEAATEYASFDDKVYGIKVNKANTRVPTYSEFVDLKSVLNTSENLFDTSAVLLGKYIYGTSTGSEISYETSTNSKVYEKAAKIRANTDYTLTYDSEADASAIGKIALCDEDKIKLSVTTYTGGTRELHINYPQDCYLYFQCAADTTNLMLVESDTPPEEYIPIDMNTYGLTVNRELKKVPTFDEYSAFQNKVSEAVSFINDLFDASKLKDNRATHEVLENGDIKVIADGVQMYQFAYVDIDVSNISAVLLTFGGYEGNGQAHSVAFGTPSEWINRYTYDAAPRVVKYNTLNMTTLRIGLYVTFTETGNDGDYIIYKDIHVENIADAVLYEKLFLHKLPDYYFTEGYITEKASFINSIAAGCLANGDLFAFVTDFHYGLNQLKSIPMLRYLTKSCNIQRIFLGGDLRDNGDNIPYPHIVKDFQGVFQNNNGRVYNVVGNHEYFGSVTDTKLYYVMNSMNNDQIGNNERNYYYVDNVQQKIRYIVLNAYSESTDGGSSAAIGYEQAQVTWFSDIALNVESGWTVIIFTHRLYDVTATAITTPSRSASIISAIDNYAGNGEIACVITGHSHIDKITHTPGGVPVVVTTCDKNVPWINSQGVPDITNRDTGTIREQAFDVVALDKTNRKLTFVRCGCPALNGIDSDPGTEVEYREVTY